eukprot:maker-scaffold5509_size4573-snap-gene-0.4 protein:Tk10757 transcript:maker-scaffold5509_size4573-snap-gene-0.4-mRNA-1 annotation:"bcs-1 protein"
MYHKKPDAVAGVGKAVLAEARRLSGQDWQMRALMKKARLPRLGKAEIWPAYKPSYPEEPASYQYNYEVRDEYAGLNFDANEAREAYNTNGGYNVLLPDGRTQR